MSDNNIVKKIRDLFPNHNYALVKNTDNAYLYFLTPKNKNEYGCLKVYVDKNSGKIKSYPPAIEFEEMM